MPTLADEALPTRMPRLDGLRGVAILLVLCHQLDRMEGGGLVQHFLDHYLEAGWIGVQLFFVLSGFLITGILVDTRRHEHPYREFLVRRVLRIFPLYFGALVLFTVILPVLGAVPAEYADHAGWYWVFLSNWLQPWIEGPLPHFWSLAVEEQFYLLWPLAALGLEPRRLLQVCIAVAVVSLVCRVVMVAMALPTETVYVSSLSRMDALALGGAVAVWLRLPGNLRRACAASRGLWMAAVAATVLLLAIPGIVDRTSHEGQTVGYSLLAADFALLVLALASLDASGRSAFGSRWLASRPMALLGLFSFGMYVFHKPLNDLLGTWVLATAGIALPLHLGAGLAYIAAGLVVVFLAGAASHGLYERHFLALRGRLASPHPGNQPR